MGRLIYVPQYAIKMRYPEWHVTEFEHEFKKNFDEVITLGGYPKQLTLNEYGNTFSPIKASIKYELDQVREYMNLKLYEDDVLYLADLSFPGFFANVLHHKKPKKIFAYVHGTSKNNYDYFQPVRKSKWQVECGQAEIFDTIFVATEYHKNKLGWNNTKVVALPKPPFKLETLTQMFNENKVINIFSASRPTKQKVNKKMEKAVEKMFGKIDRVVFKDWYAYYSYLAQVKILISTASEETFGYQIMDAILAGTIPIAPNRFSYPELLPREYLYDDIDELMDTLAIGLNGHLPVPELLCQDLVDNFYENIIGIMKE